MMQHVILYLQYVFMWNQLLAN